MNSSRPLIRSRICGSTAWATRIAPEVFYANNRSISATGLASTAARKITPALASVPTGR
jgi:hypothetical protein